MITSDSSSPFPTRPVHTTKTPWTSVTIQVTPHHQRMAKFAVGMLDLKATS